MTGLVVGPGGLSGRAEAGAWRPAGQLQMSRHKKQATTSQGLVTSGLGAVAPRVDFGKGGDVGREVRMQASPTQGRGGGGGGGEECGEGEYFSQTRHWERRGPELGDRFLTLASLPLPRLRFRPHPA